MRISGGALRGRTVACPPGTIRPAMERMRESLFAILGELTGVSFLDLFSGSGLVGLEAYSRGARPVVLVERDAGKRRTIAANLAGLDPLPRVIVAPVERFLARNRTSSTSTRRSPTATSATCCSGSRPGVRCHAVHGW